VRERGPENRKFKEIWCKSEENKKKGKKFGEK